MHKDAEVQDPNQIGYAEMRKADAMTSKKGEAERSREQKKTVTMTGRGISGAADRRVHKWGMW